MVDLHRCLHAVLFLLAGCATASETVATTESAAIPTTSRPEGWCEVERSFIQQRAQDWGTIASDLGEDLRHDYGFYEDDGSEVSWAVAMEFLAHRQRLLHRRFSESVGQLADDVLDHFEHCAMSSSERARLTFSLRYLATMMDPALTSTSTDPEPEFPVIDWEGLGLMDLIVEGHGVGSADMRPDDAG